MASLFPSLTTATGRRTACSSDAPLKLRASDARLVPPKPGGWTKAQSCVDERLWRPTVYCGRSGTASLTHSAC